ncbi:MAG: hypothetical protein L0177_11055 [Chloroflexi bacterium]|nr:hypothetical protein [Chloroflexota bacterium]
MPKTVICAHRGLDDSAPENTLAAFEAALDRGMAIEFDIQMTADGHLVIMHDQAVDRTTNGSGRVSEMTLSELRKLDAGSWFGPEFAGQRVPTFDEALELIRGRALASPTIALDIKSLPPGLVKLVCDALDRQGLMEETVGIGAIIMSADVRRQFHEVSSSFQCAAVAQRREGLDAALSDAHSTWVYARFVPDAEDVRRVALAGKRLFVSGDEVSYHVERAYDAYRAGPDVVLTWHPTRLAELAGL